MKWLMTILMAAIATTSLQSDPVVGYATYYTTASCQRESQRAGSGILTASGRRYDEQALTCALPFRPAKWGKLYRVTNLANGRSVVVRHIDLGPGKKSQRRGVVIDLTPLAFSKLGKLAQGKIFVKVEPITNRRKGR